MELLRATVARASTAELALAVSYAVVVAAVLAEGVELGLAEGRQRTRRWPVTARMAVGGLLAGALVSSVYAHVWPSLRGLAPAPLVAVGQSHPLLEWATAFVVWDALGYAYHRIGHGTAVGWASHQVHHGGREYDLSLAWRQTWFPVHALALFPLAAVAGVELPVVAGCAAVSHAWQALLHTHRSLSLPRVITSVVATPVTHRRHHLAEGAPVNLGPVLTVWDRLAGTWDPRPVAMDATYGSGGPDDRGATWTELAGWVRLLRSADGSRSPGASPEAPAERRYDPIAPCPTGWTRTHCSTEENA